jgi:hypothetical protein
VSGAFATLSEIPLKIYSTREEWLVAAVEELRPLFAAKASPIAAKVRVTCGFPSNAKRSRAVGECWADTASADRAMEILISPTIADPMRVADILVHELCHTVAGAMNHGASFRKAADAMHLIPAAGKVAYKATSGGDAFKDAFGAIIDGLGEYPHAALSMATRKTQATRMLKACCPSCGYTVRLTSKWAAQGLPSCPNDGDTFFLEA